MRVVVLGGYGEFGSRISSWLKAIVPSNTRVVVAGRRPVLAQGMAAKLEAEWACIDVASPHDELVKAFSGGSTTVINTVGPFTPAESGTYRVAEACIASRANYIDLADHREYVSQVPASLDAQAKQAGVVVCIGASTVPGVSSAAVEALKHDWLSTLNGAPIPLSVELSITPGHHTPRGISTIQSVLSYCGMPFEQLVDGRWCEVVGWHSGAHQRLGLGLGLWLGLGLGLGLVLAPKHVHMHSHASRNRCTGWFGKAF